MKTKIACSAKRAASNGFSIVELIMVMGVIGILAGLTFPLTTAVRARAQRVSCLNNLRQWGMALNLYLDENRGVYPSWEKGKSKAWFNVLPQYLNQQTMEEAANSKSGVATPGTGRKSLFLCPGDTREIETAGDYYSSYTFNKHVGKTAGATRQHAIKNPDIFVVFSETADGETPGVDLSNLGDTEEGMSAFRHSGSICFGFADGHAASFSRAKAWRAGLSSTDNFGGLQWNPANDDLTGGSGE